LQVVPDVVLWYGHAALANPAMPGRHVSNKIFKYDDNLFIKIIHLVEK